MSAVLRFVIAVANRSCSKVFWSVRYGFHPANPTWCGRLARVCAINSRVNSLRPRTRCTFARSISTPSQPSIPRSVPPPMKAGKRQMQLAGSPLYHFPLRMNCTKSWMCPLVFSLVLIVIHVLKLSLNVKRLKFTRNSRVIGISFTMPIRSLRRAARLSNNIMLN